MTIYQHIDEYHPFDGMGNDCRGFRKFFDSLNLENYILTRNNRSEEGSPAIRNCDTSLKEKISDIHILHYGGSGYPLSAFLKRKGRKILRFHNMTPPEYYRACNPGVYLSMEKFFRKSILELNAMENAIEVSLSVSDFNSETLNQYSRIPSKTLPILRDYHLPKIRIPNFDCPLEIAFISRFVPNKRIEDIIKVLFYITKIQPKTKLHLIGSVVPGIHEYYDFLVETVKNLNLEENVAFHFRASETEKSRILSDSHFFLCMSEHEGFGIPLVEAMEESLPILAYRSSAIEETLNGGGILLNRKDYTRIAELMIHLSENRLLVKTILNKQYQAMKKYVDFSYKSILNDTIAPKKFQFSVVYD